MYIFQLYNYLLGRNWDSSPETTPQGCNPASFAPLPQIHPSTPFLLGLRAALRHMKFISRGSYLKQVWPALVWSIDAWDHYFSLLLSKLVDDMISLTPGRLFFHENSETSCCTWSVLTGRPSLAKPKWKIWRQEITIMGWMRSSTLFIQLETSYLSNQWLVWKTLELSSDSSWKNDANKSSSFILM